ncbi:hypothetical protein KAR48_17535 [bacterium]|nr:hypothetical protein [bacterium]
MRFIYKIYILLILVVAFCQAQSQILKEPEYNSSTQQYCSISFSDNCKDKIMIIFDGDDVYIDKNCNSDLTESHEKFQLFKNARREFASIRDIPIQTGASNMVKQLSLYHMPSYMNRGKNDKSDNTGLIDRSRIRFKVIESNGQMFSGTYDSEQQELPTDKNNAPDLRLYGKYQIILINDKLRFPEPGKFRLDAHIQIVGQDDGNIVYIGYSRISESIGPEIEFKCIDQFGKIKYESDIKLTERC